jgi:SAM-dependent methyltransferase
MDVSEQRVTRGHGLLEGFLAQKRADRANSLIPEGLRAGRILDIGCGSYPAFLTGSRFSERYGLDRVPLASVRAAGIKLVEHDIGDGSPVPFADSFFDVVTMLAVFEHLEDATLRRVLKEVRRILRPGGLYVMTTPVKWTEQILKVMSRVRLVSHEEIGEHKAQYSGDEIVSLLVDTGYERSRIRQGTFELGMNLWAVAQKT